MKQSIIISVSLSIIAATASIALGIAALNLAGKLQDVERNQSISLTQSTYAREKLEFCLNNSITPCDDRGIDAWNTSHPNNFFTLKNYQTLIEEGIESYNTSHR